MKLNHVGTHPLPRRRRRSRRTRCWWVGSCCRVLAGRSRSTAWSCRSVSCRGFTVCCRAKTLPSLKVATTLHRQFCSLGSLRCGWFHFNIILISFQNVCAACWMIPGSCEASGSVYKVIRNSQLCMMHKQPSHRDVEPGPHEFLLYSGFCYYDAGRP